MEKEVLYTAQEVLDNLYEQLPINFYAVDIHDKSECEEALMWADSLVGDLDFNITQLFAEKMNLLHGKKADVKDVIEYVAELDEEIKKQEELLHDAKGAVETFKDAIDYLENEDIEVLYGTHSEWR